MLKLTEHFLYYVPQHALAPLKRSGTKLEKTSLSAGVFRGHDEHNIGTTPVSVEVSKVNFSLLNSKWV